ncbi:hypothetical protein [Aliiroseovarius sediminilitoris]|nr:hypothetical protein [Aliiroseovarius sediminilitoris]
MKKKNLASSIKRRSFLRLAIHLPLCLMVGGAVLNTRNGWVLRKDDI